MEHCYWDHTGKYQTLVEELESKAPRIGYTNNKYMNLFLVIAHLYYDAYNNGGGNIADCFMQDLYTKVSPYFPGVSARPFIRCEYETMEGILDRILEYLQDKDLSFPLYTVWLNYEQDTLSREQPPAAELDNWNAITFGEENRMKNYCLRRTGNGEYRDVTEEMRAVKATPPKLDTVIHSATANRAKASESSKPIQPEGR